MKLATLTVIRAAQGGLTPVAALSDRSVTGHYRFGSSEQGHEKESKRCGKAPCRNFKLGLGVSVLVKLTPASALVKNKRFLFYPPSN